jgi:hypothetical protein
MKPLRIVALVLAAATWSVTLAFAGDCGKSASAAAAGDKACCGSHATATAASAAACPASANCPMGSAQCTAAMRAQCAKGASAMTADHCAKGANATAAAAGMSADHCAKGASANASGATCADHCAKGANASASAAAAGKGYGTCPFHSATMVMAAGGKCDMKGASHHDDCAVCADQALCDNDLRAMGARSQVVALRNGAMIVYAADSPENVRALQAAMARHNERMMTALGTGSDASLCGECRTFRGAMASGKFTRELVNVKNGCQILLTSNDRTIVRRIHDMAGSQVAVRTKI